MSPAAQMFDMGGTPEQNAAIAVIMIATMATGQVDDPDRLVDQASAASIVSDILLMAASAGFGSGTEFRALVGAGAMTLRLEALAAQVVGAAGGPEKIFNILAMAATPAEAMGATQ